MPRRAPPPPVPTLVELQRSSGGWVWLHCDNAHVCHHKAAVAIAPFVIRWGPQASSDQPSWVNSQVGFQAFPVERMIE
jgi:hypothetical protein